MSAEKNPRGKRGWQAPQRVLSGLVLVILLAVVPTGGALARDVVQAFLLATRADDIGFLSQMAELNLNPKTRDDLGNSLLMLAIREGGEKMALALLQDPEWQAPSLLDAENKLGENALMIAAHRGAQAPARRLIDLGAQTNREGWGPLHYAATSGHGEMIHLLVESHAYVDAESPNGITPLMMAARFNQRGAVQALVALGADPTISSRAGLTARDYARDNNNTDLAFWLELQEIAFVNRYLKENPAFAPKETEESPAVRSGTEAPATQGTEILEGIR